MTASLVSCPSVSCPLLNDPAVLRRAIASWKPQPAARLDAKALRAALPDIAATYTTTTTTRVLRVKNPKEN